MMDTENVSTKTFLQWRKDIKGNGTAICSPTTAGFWQGMTLATVKTGRKKHIIFCVLSNELT